MSEANPQTVEEVIAEEAARIVAALAVLDIEVEPWQARHLAAVLLCTCPVPRPTGRKGNQLHLDPRCPFHSPSRALEHHGQAIAQAFADGLRDGQRRAAVTRHAEGCRFPELGPVPCTCGANDGLLR